MKRLPALALLTAVYACSPKPGNIPDKDTAAALKLLDSLEATDAGTLIKYAPDSFAEQDTITKMPQLILSDQDISAIKKAVATKKMERPLAKKLFSTTEMFDEMFDAEMFGFTFYPFDENPDMFNEFALSLGPPGEPGNNIFFFKDKKLITRLSVYHKYGLELEHYKDETGHTVIYFKENLLSGTAMSWNEYRFYRYEDDDTLRHIYTCTADAFIDPLYPNARIRGLDVTVAGTQPLTLKMAFEISLTDNDSIPPLLKDSVLVQCPYNEKLHHPEPDYKKAGITRAQLASYAPESSAVLFIAAYSNLLRQKLNDPVQHRLIINYLKEIEK